MSTVGLRRVGNFDEVLALATRDDAIAKANIGIGLRNAATRIIHSQDFQRVRDTLENDLVEQEKRHIDAQQAQHNITNIAMETSLRRSDLDYLINNLQQPPPPPQAPQQPAAAVWVQGQPRLVRVVARGWTLMAVLAMRATCTAARTRAARCRGCRNRRPLPQRALPTISAIRTEDLLTVCLCFMFYCS